MKATLEAEELGNIVEESMHSESVEENPCLEQIDEVESVIKGESIDQTQIVIKKELARIDISDKGLLTNTTNINEISKSNLQLDVNLSEPNLPFPNNRI